MLVLEIALGIVLGYVLLVILPEIIGAVLQLALIVVPLLVLAALIAWVIYYPQSFFSFVALIMTFAFVLGAGRAVKLLFKRLRITLDFTEKEGRKLLMLVLTFLFVAAAGGGGGLLATQNGRMTSAVIVWAITAGILITICILMFRVLLASRARQMQRNLVN